MMVAISAKRPSRVDMAGSIGLALFSEGAASSPAAASCDSPRHCPMVSTPAGRGTWASRQYRPRMEAAVPGKRQRLAAACDEHLAFLREYGFAWEPSRPAPAMMGECWDASSPWTAITVCVDRRDGDFTVSIGPAGHEGLDLHVVADRLATPKEARPRHAAKTKGGEAKRVQELAVFLRGPGAPLVQGDFSSVQDLLGL